MMAQFADTDIYVSPGVDLFDIDPPLLTQYASGAANKQRPLDSRTY